MKAANISIIKLLPYDGEVLYFGPVLSDVDAEAAFDSLHRLVEWKNDEAVIFGRHIVTRRMVAWYGDEEYEYAYSKRNRVALPWFPELIALKKQCERITGAAYNSCLLNLYHNGEEGMGWHGDDEKTLVRDSSIASLSLGAERRFCLKHRTTGETISIVLEDGSLLEMKGATQRHWRHSLPKSRRVNEPRISLTFRTMQTQRLS